MKTFLKILASLFAVILLLIGGFLFVNWAPDVSVESLKARWAQPPSTFIPVDGMQVHLRDEGPKNDPSPLVLLHGTSSSLHTWEGWTQALKGEHRVIRFDLPAFGLTGPSPDQDYRVPAYVKFVKDVLAALNVHKCVIAGNSFGGNVAWETALAAPDVVKALILVDSGGYVLHPKSIPIGLLIAKTPALKPIMQYVLPRKVIADSVKNVYGDPSKVSEEEIDLYYDMALREGNRDALSKRLMNPPGEDAESISKLKLPTLILWGEKDQLIPPDHAVRFHREIAGSQLVMFDGLGHVPMEEDPVRTVAEVKKFLAKL